MTQTVDTQIEKSARKALYRIGGWAALIAVFLFRRNLGAEVSLFSEQMPPHTAGDWITLLQGDPLLGLTYLNLFDLVNYALLGLMFLALCPALRRINQTSMRIAVSLGLVGVAVYFASNQAFAMLALSGQYATATTEAQKATLLAAGEAQLAINNPGAVYQSTGIYLSFLFVTLAGLMISGIMLRSGIFSRLTACLGILAHVLLLGYFVTLIFAPSLIAIPHATAAIPLVLWELLIARKLFQLAQDLPTAGANSIRATRIVASILGIYAGCLGAMHGYFEILQGSGAPDGVFIRAIGLPCQPETISHACLPALTLIPNFQVSGFLTINLSIAVLLWAALFIEHRHGRWVLFLLTIAMMLVGGGFIPPFHAMIAAAAATQINTSLSWWRTRLSSGVLHVFSALWPWILILYLVWAVLQTVFGEALNTFLLGIGFVLLPIEIGIVLLAVVSAFAHDIQKQSENVRVPSMTGI